MNRSYRSLITQGGFHFNYYGLSWLPAPSSGDLDFLFGIIVVCLIGIGFGWFYRLSCMTLFVSFGYLFFLNKLNYSNFHYLILLYALILLVVPTHNKFSFDSIQFNFDEPIRRWHIWLFRFQVGIIYVFSGIAKINFDWLKGQPLAIWLSSLRNTSLGPIVSIPEISLLISFGIIVIELLAVPLLLIDRTRTSMILILLFFHGLSGFLLDVEMLAILSVLGLMFFLGLEWFSSVGLKAFDSTAVGENNYYGKTLFLWFITFIILTTQILLPVRPYVYWGNDCWNGRGHYFSWHLAMNDNRGWINFHRRKRDQKNSKWTEVDLASVTQIDKTTWEDALWTPELIRQVAHYIADNYERNNPGSGLEVIARTGRSLNGRPLQPVIKESINLVRVKRDWSPNRWIITLLNEAPSYERTFEFLGD